MSALQTSPAARYGAMTSTVDDNVLVIFVVYCPLTSSGLHLNSDVGLEVGEY